MTPASERPDITFEEARHKIVGWADCCSGEFNVSDAEDEASRVELDAVLRAIAPVTDAGLDVERLARALHAFYAGKDTRDEFFPPDCTHPADARFIAAAYASADPNDAIAAEYAALSRQAEKETA